MSHFAKTITQNILLLFAACLAGLVLVEITIRIFFPVQIHPINSLEALPGYPLVARFKPHTDFEVSGDGWGAKTHINSQGLRDYEYTIKKPPMTFRIAMVGDSLVEARQVPIEKTSAKLLENLLQSHNQTISNKKYDTVEVINFGFPGYGTDEELIRIQSDVLRYNPNLVILVFLPNDIADVGVYNNLFTVKNGQLKSTDFSRNLRQKFSIKLFSRLHSFYFFKERLMNYPQIYSSVSSLVKRALGPFPTLEEQHKKELLNRENSVQIGRHIKSKDYPLCVKYYFSDYKEDIVPYIQLVGLLMSEINRLLVTHDSQLLVVGGTHSVQLLPKRMKLWQKNYLAQHENVDVRIPNQMIGSYLADADIPYFDLLDIALKHTDGGQNLVLENDGHWSEEGNNFAAVEIYNYLIQHPNLFNMTTPHSSD